MATVGLIGTLDTKGAEYAWLLDELASHGCDTVMIDVGTFSRDATHADVTPAEVAAAGGASLDALQAADDRGRAMAVMGTGSAAIVAALHAEGRIDALLAIGGSGGSSIAAEAMRALPVGVPKVLVSTMASGDVSPYVGESDVTLMYSVVDISGINRISRRVLGNAVAAAAGMARRHEGIRDSPDEADGKPLIGMTMFGLTTPAADEARARLDELGYEVVVFHATGSGGKAMEGLVAGGFLAGVLDLTTTELADELVGGVLTAGPHRLEAAATSGTPQVVSVGALDMVNFGPKASVPARFSERVFLVHNPTITLMRTTRAEMAELGGIMAAKLAKATGPTEVFLPLKGLSGIDVEGGPFADPDADEALFAAIRSGLDGTAVAVHDVPAAVNDEGFGRRMAEALDRLIRTRP